MSRLVYLSRVDIRQVQDRSTGAITLRYTGKKLRFFDRLFGYPDGTFFAVVLSEVPLPEALTTLASAVGVDLDSMPLTVELRRAVADLLVCEATMEAPEYLSMCADPRTAWLETDVRELEHRSLAAENRVRETSRAIETSLRRRIAPPPVALPPIRTFAPMPPAGFGSRFALRLPAPTRAAPPPEPEEAEEEVDEIEVEDGPIETSEAAGRRVLAAVKIAREQELPQRLPGGARRALGHLPSGLYVSHGSALDRKADICSAMVEGAESGKRAGESAVIDWDGEWPVVARRYGSHGRIVYRVEEALRRSGIATGAAA
jgi:hypothetical protein